MVTVNVDDDLYSGVSKFVKKHKLLYPSIRDFVNKSVLKNFNRYKK